jgi:hypothetical protein
VTGETGWKDIETKRTDGDASRYSSSIIKKKKREIRRTDQLAEHTSGWYSMADGSTTSWIKLNKNTSSTYPQSEHETKSSKLKQAQVDR